MHALIDRLTMDSLLHPSLSGPGAKSLEETLRRFGAQGRGMAGSSSVAAVQATNDDASASKLSCVSKNYIADKYVRFFVRRPVKRSPIINRGYYARWAAMRKMLLQFLEVTGPSVDGPQKKQILSLGAGFDTLFFQLKDEGRAPHLFVEMDFLEVTSKKAAIIASHEELFTKLGTKLAINKEKGEIHSENYKLLPADLRDLKAMDRVFEDGGLDPRMKDSPLESPVKKDLLSGCCLPTFVIAECVLIYLEPEVSRAVVKWAGENLLTSVFVIYEQIHPHDAFGQQMVKNLEAWIESRSRDSRVQRATSQLVFGPGETPAPSQDVSSQEVQEEPGQHFANLLKDIPESGSPLLGLEDTPTLESKERRFTDLGWQRAGAVDMDELYNHHLDPVDRRRIERLEIFDEFEEWNIMQEHYCVAYGVKDPTGIFQHIGLSQAKVGTPRKYGQGGQAQLSKHN